MGAQTVAAPERVVTFRLGDIQGASPKELLAKASSGLCLEGRVISFTEDAATGRRLAVVEVKGVRTPVLVPIPRKL